MDAESSDRKQNRDPEDLTTAEVPDQSGSSAPKPPSGPMIAGRYEVLGQLGEGGMGVVFKVRDHKVGRRLIALKRILKLDDRARARFKSEINSAANLNHRNICKVHDSGEGAEGPFFTMELLNGGSLADRVVAQGPLSHEALMDVARQLAQALRYAHRNGVQHRDIKPTNVLFAAEDGDPMLVDFGIARIGTTSGLSVTNVGLGTPGFSAPEQLANAKAADHRADLYSLGATLYYALTAKMPSVDVDLSDLPSFWKTLIGKCMKEDPTDRYFDAGEILEYIEKAPQSSGADLAVQCSVCGAGNPAGSSFCRQCGAGLSEPCPDCGGLNRAGQEVCGHCGINIPKRWASDKWLREARDHTEKREYHRAERAAGEVLKREPQQVEASLIHADAREMLRQLEALRDAAIHLESEKKYREAEQAWHRVLDIQPEHRQAVAAIERLRGRTLDERFLEKAGEFRSAIEDRALSRATWLLHELRTIAAPAAASQLPQSEQALETLRRTLILDLKEAFGTALQRRRRKIARAVIGKLSELQVDPAEVAAMLEQLKSSERGWRRRRTARRLVGGILLLLFVAGGYLLVVDRYNRQVAGDAAAALARGEEPVLAGFLPSWPRDERVILVERSKLCRTLDGRYGSDEWRRWVQDVELFGSRRNGPDLVAEYNWLVLRQIADAALAGSDGDLNRARDLVRKIAWKELGPRGGSFRQRQDALREILGGWYDGSLSLEVFADARLVGEPELEFVSEQAARITNPETDCETIRRLARLFVRLKLGEHIPDQIRAHNERVVEAIGDAVDDPRSSRIANLLNHLCVETGDPDRATQEVSRALDRLVDDLQWGAEADPAQQANVIALLVAIDRGMTDPPAELKPAVAQLVGEQTAELLPLIEHTFETEGDVGALLARLHDQSAYWSYLGNAAAGRLRERERRLRELHERWSGGPLLVAPLCQLGRVEETDQLWLGFERATETRALDAFYEEDPQQAARLAELLRAFDYETEPLRDLSSRLRIHEVLLGLVDVLPEPAYEELRRRLFTPKPLARRATAPLATDVVLAAIESGALDAAHDLAPVAEAPELAVIARSLRQLADLPEATLRELEASVLADVRLPMTSRRIRDEVEYRLDLCLPASTTLRSPGQFSVGAAHEVSRVSVRSRDDASLDLEPLGRGGEVYRVPFLETGPVTLTLWDSFGVATSRPFTVVHSMLRNPAEVTLRSARVVEGDPAVLAIRPRLAFDRVTVEGVDRTGELVDRGDHWVLELVTSLEPGQPAATRQWSLRLLMREGVQKLEVPLTVVAPEIVEAEEALKRGRYERVFDRLDIFARRDHDALRHLEHEAGARWIKQLQASELTSRAEADALAAECGRYLAKVPAALHQDAAAIRDRAWIRRIELTSTWGSVDAMRNDLAFLQGLGETGELQRKMIAWLAGAVEWAEPIVQHMERRLGDWSTVRDRSPSTCPAVLVHRRTGLEFVYVPARSFGIGGRSRSPRETPHRYVTIRGFYVSRTECTRAAWAAGRREPPPPVRQARLPETNVPFVEAAAWCHALGLDLPTEAQWELAAAGVGAREYPWGDKKCQPNVKRGFRSSKPAEVGSVDCDRSPYGVMDMAGNVREWCYPVSNATYRILPEDVQDPPAWLGGIIVRGASWQNPQKDGRTHHRVFTPGSPTEVGSADPTVGFRPVLTR